MIIDITLKGIKCDRCGDLFTACGDFSNYDPIVAKAEFQKELSDLADGTDWLQFDGSHYCDECWHYNNADKRVPLPPIEKCRVCGQRGEKYHTRELRDDKSVWWEKEDLCVNCAPKDKD